jgi:hypothetical protein
MKNGHNLSQKNPHIENKLLKRNEVKKVGEGVARSWDLHILSPVFNNLQE